MGLELGLFVSPGCVGPTVGLLVGTELVGYELGLPEGELDGYLVSPSNVGSIVGFPVGCALGDELGFVDGSLDGFIDGNILNV